MKRTRVLIVAFVVIAALVGAGLALANWSLIGPGPIPAPDGGSTHYLHVQDGWYMIQPGGSADLHVDAFHPDCGGRIKVDQTRVDNTVDVQIHTIIRGDVGCTTSGVYQWMDVVLTGTYDPVETYTITVNGYEAYRIEPTPTPTPTPPPPTGRPPTPTPSGGHIP